MSASRAQIAIDLALLCVLPTCTSAATDALSGEPMHGTVNGAPWTAGPGAVNPDPTGIIMVRIFEDGTPGGPCSIKPTTGRRIEIRLPHLAPGKYDATQDLGFRVEAWNGTTGESDPRSAIEMYDAPKKAGGTVTGRARFSSSLNTDHVEGQFSALVCQDLP